MSRAPLLAAPAVAALLFPVPAMAAADDGGLLSSPPISLIVSLIGLAVAVVLLIEAVSVRRVALGGAIAEKISYVVLATMCLAASALAQWVRNFVRGVTLDQIQFASQVLVIAAMVLLALYFASVRKALQSYLKSMTSGEMLLHEVGERVDSGEEATRG